MGIWGYSLYANDTTCDVRDTYIGFLQDGLSDEDAYNQTLCMFHEYLEDKDDAPLFWYALSETQWKLGRLMPEVKSKALDWIARYGGLDLWLESSKKGNGWKKTLETLKNKLESPLPPRKKIRKPTIPDQNFWNLNDLYAYQFPYGVSECAQLAGKYIVLQKIGEGKDFLPGVKMRVQVYNKLFDSLPTVNDLSGVDLLPLDLYERLNNPGGRSFGLELCMSSLMFMAKVKDYPHSQCTFIGNQPGPKNKLLRKHDKQILDWQGIQRWLTLYYNDWHDVEYESDEDGIYRYVDE